jgi:hypothetical protein
MKKKRYIQRQRISDSRNLLNAQSRVMVDLLCVALLISFAVAIAYPRWRAWIDWRDEGLLAYGAVRALNGEVPHRDFVSLQPALSYYTAAIVFKLFGTSLLTLRVFGLTIFLLLPLLIYAVGRKFVGPLASLAAAAPVCILGMPYMRFVPFAVWQGIAVSFAAILLLVWAVRSNQPWLAVPAGTLVAISGLLRHDQAVYTAIASIGLVIALSFADTQFRNLRRVLLLWLGGIAIVSIPLVILWWSIGALPETFRQLVVFPFATYRKTSALPFPILFKQRSFLDAATAVLFYIPPLVQLIAAIYVVQSIVRRRFHFDQAVLIFLVVWSGLFFLQALVRSDLTHLLMTLPPFFVLVAFGWSIVRKRIANRRIDVLLSSVVAIVIASFLWMIRSVALPDMSHETELLNLPRGGVRVANAPFLANFFQTMQAAVPQTRSILALPYQPMFYFLGERRNPTRWNYLWPGDETEQDYQTLIAEAEHDPPAVILLSEQNEVASFASTIFDYVNAHYEQIDSVGDIKIYVPREAN